MRGVVTVFAGALTVAGPGSSLSSPSPRPCVDVIDKGATPNSFPPDDDGPAIRAAIRDALTIDPADGRPGVVCFPAGTYDVASRDGSSIASFNLGDPFGTQVPASDLTFVGEGARSIIRMNPPLAAPWYLFQINRGASRIRFRNLTLDGFATTPTPNVDLVAIGAGDTGATLGASNIEFVDVRFASSPNDAIRILGDGSQPNVSGVSVVGGSFVGNQHAAVDVFEGSKQITVRASVFVATTGADLATGVAGSPSAVDPVADVTVAGNIFVRNPSSPIALSLMGGTGNPFKDLLVSGNSLVGGRIALSNWDRVTLAADIVLGGSAATADPELAIARCTHVAIGGCELVRQTATAAPVVVISDNGSSGARAVSFDGNSLYQPTAAAITQFLVNDATIRDNYLAYASAIGTSAGIAIGNSTTLLSGIAITGNVIDGHLAAGALSSAISVGTGDGVYPTLIIANNVSRGTTYGVGLPSTATKIPLITNNAFEDVTADITAGGTSTKPTIALGGNMIGPAMLTGDNTPLNNVAAPPGSLYLQRNGGSTTTLWIKESATDATGWTSR